jgi:hypothetical protein
MLYAISDGHRALNGAWDLQFEDDAGRATVVKGSDLNYQSGEGKKYYMVAVGLVQ